VFIGPYDLSASLGKMSELDDPVVVAAVDRISEACVTSGVKLGVFSTSSDAALPYIQRGFTLITAGTDTLLLGQAGRDMVDRLKISS